MHEFVDPELIGLGGIHAWRHAPLPIIVRARARRRFPDAVTPVIPVGKAAAGPSNIRRPDPLHVIHKLFADTVNVGDGRIAAHPYAIVDDAAKVLDEVSV